MNKESPNFPLSPSSCHHLSYTPPFWSPYVSHLPPHFIILNIFTTFFLKPPLSNNCILPHLITIGDTQQRNPIDGWTWEFDISTKNQMETDHSMSGLLKSNDSIKTQVPDCMRNAEMENTHSVVTYDKKAVTNWQLGSQDINYKKTDCSVSVLENKIVIHGPTSSKSLTKKPDMKNIWVPDSHTNLSNHPPFF